MSSGVHSGDSRVLDVAPTGKRVEISGLTLAEFREGKLVREREFADALGLLRQIGAIPPTGARIIPPRHARQT